MGQRTTFLLLQQGEPKEAIYWHWWHDSVEGVANEIAGMTDIVERAVKMAGGVGSGDAGRLLRKWLPRFEIQEVTETDLREDIQSDDKDDIIMHAAAGEVCVVFTVFNDGGAVVDAIIANPSTPLLRRYLDAK